MQTVEELQAHYKAVKARIAAGAYKPPVQEEMKPITKGEKILIETAVKHKIPVKDLRTDVRTNKLVAARWECMYRLRSELKLPLTAIGRFMNKDHATVLHAIRKYEKARQQVAGK